MASGIQKDKSGAQAACIFMCGFFMQRELEYLSVLCYSEASSKLGELFPPVSLDAVQLGELDSSH